MPNESWICMLLVWCTLHRQRKTYVLKPQAYQALGPSRLSQALQVRRAHGAVGLTH